MRSVRMRIIAAVAVLAAVGVGGWQLLPSSGDNDKTIVVGTTDSITSLDPAGAYDSGSWALYSNIYQSLLTYEPGGVEPVPDAAKSCGFEGGGLTTYQCELRDDLKFPSGRKVTVKDVKYSIDRIKAINSPVGPAPLLSNLKSVDTDGDNVVFRLSSGDATFPFKLATGVGAIVDSTKYPENKVRTDDGADGTGPYTLTGYTKDEKITLEPNGSYKGAFKAGKPVELRYYADSAKLQAAWKAGEVSVATRQLPPKMLASLSASDTTQRVTEAESSETRNLYFNVREGSPLRDERVRRALAWLVNRQEIATSVYDGTVEPLYSLIPTGITGHSTSFFDAYPQPDVDKAKQLLKAAGVSTPVTFTYGYGKRGAAEPEAAELKRQLEAGGLFKVDVKGYEWSEFKKQWADGKLDAYAVGWVADYPDADTFAAPLVGTGSTMNTGYSSKAVDKLILSSQQYADRSRVSTDFRRLQDDVAQDVPVIPLWQRKEYVVATEDVGGSQYLADGNGVFRLWSLNWI
ncbi:peptide-binding protein [Streptomyces roseirectus]|uniref:Peptide-binding protein n=1 Tax=Streptomyces roseirectus TaxID=2768066 RepID=A0A7H0ICW8_9ACTN|nr:ABC transporter substrate-binding protein [Streptomyces roseirectus]QNP70634.1 peptide-binding protein [Streptomyces roseirectus]